MLVHSRYFSNSSVRYVIKTVTIIGGGTMGSGIAQVAAQAGNNVTIVEPNQTAITKAIKLIEDSTKRVAKKQYKKDFNGGENYIKSTLSRLRGNTNLEEATNADLIIEAISEHIETKIELFKKLDELAPKNTILATNTSSLSVRELAKVTKRPDKFAGLHFFNPVSIAKLLEVVKTPEVSEPVYEDLMSWGKAIGKFCVTCKDTPGFIVNRLLVPTSNEAIKMLERGDASAEDIDTAMKLGAGYTIGPLELADYIGLDLGLAILDGWYRRFPQMELFRPSALLRKLVEEGKYGVKSGEGIYKYKQ